MNRLFVAELSNKLRTVGGRKKTVAGTNLGNVTTVGRVFEWPKTTTSLTM